MAIPPAMFHPAAIAPPLARASRRVNEVTVFGVSGVRLSTRARGRLKGRLRYRETMPS
ncbi:MAG: hypothetical protein IPI33_10870 [Dehalococcoidia bacterium]|nr:hypothetical protein [Dehalococcoidia bacterium]